MSTKPEVNFVSLPEIGTDHMVYSSEDWEFWRHKPPKAVVFCSSSLRKAILLAFALADYDLEKIQHLPFMANLPFDPTKVTTQLEFQRLIEKHIPNGDGEVTEPLFVGYLRGVPTYMVPQNGETNHNDKPLVQSANKVFDVQVRLESIGIQNVLYFGSDSTGLINEVHLGKPKYYIGKVGRFERGSLDVDWNNADEVEEYKRAYIQQFYSEDTPIQHRNGLVAEWKGSSQQNEQDNSTQETLSDELSAGYFIAKASFTTLDVVVTDVLSKLDELELYLFAAGGGLFQQFIKWKNDILEQVEDALMKQELAKLPVEQRPWALICHIMGMPAWQLIHVFEQLVAARRPTSELVKID